MPGGRRTGWNPAYGLFCVPEVPDLLVSFVLEPVVPVLVPEVPVEPVVPVVPVALVSVVDEPVEPVVELGVDVPDVLLVPLMLPLVLPVVDVSVVVVSVLLRVASRLQPARPRASAASAETSVSFNWLLFICYCLPKDSISVVGPALALQLKRTPRG